MTARRHVLDIRVETTRKRQSCSHIWKPNQKTKNLYGSRIAGRLAHLSSVERPFGGAVPCQRLHASTRPRARPVVELVLHGVWVYWSYVLRKAVSHINTTPTMDGRYTSIATTAVAMASPVNNRSRKCITTLAVAVAMRGRTGQQAPTSYSRAADRLRAGQGIAEII